MSITRTQMARQLMQMGGEALEAGAPDLTIEGNQIPQQEEMASAPGIDAELYQLFLDALRKGDVPQGTTFDKYKEIMMELASKQEMMQPEMQEGIMQGNEMNPERETAAYGGIMGLDGRRQYGFGSFVRSISRAISRPVKKAVSAVKKVAKSPIGKAALMYAATAGIGSLGAGNQFGSLFKAGTYSPRNVFANLGASKNRLLNYIRPATSVATGGTQSGISQAYTLADRAQDIDEKSAILNKAFSTVTGAAKNTSAPSNLLQTLTASRYAIPLLGGAAAGAATAMQPEQDIEAEIASVDRGDDFAKKLQAIIDAKGGYQRFGLNPQFAQSAADGGRIGYAGGTPGKKAFKYKDKPYGPFKKKTKKAAEGGLMSLDGNEMDLRGGGFVPLGAKEKADDVPARLSKNEFVFTADAVRAAGGGNIDKGADKMYRTMKQLEGVVA